MRQRLRPWIWRLTLAAALALVFLAYAQPALMQSMADQIWACF